MQTQGTPTEMNFSTETAKFEGNFRLDKSVKGATVVYLNADYWYPNGYDYTVAVDDVHKGADFTVDVSDPTRLTVLFDADTIHDGKLVTITAQPKP
jgi:hypothetical protein